MTREERLDLLKQIEKDIHVCSLESTFLDDAKSCAIHSAIEELEQEPCDDAIGRSDMLDAIGHGTTYTSKELQKIIKALPPVTPQKTGHWILADVQSEEDIENDNYRYICSECQHSDIHAKDIEVPYCWNCGAKMEGEEKE